MDDTVQTAELSQSPSLITLSNPDSSAAEAIRALRTHVMARHVQNGHRALAICGPSEGVGCTFVAANLAVSLSQIGVNSLLIDANMRKPSLANIFHNSSQRSGIETALSQGCDFIDCIEAEVLPSLSVLFAGKPVSNAQELLAGNRFNELMDFCLREFDATIVDTPPANEYSDVRRVSTVVGYSLIVTRRNKSLIGDVKTLMEHLRGDNAEVIGTVLNET